MFKFANLTAPSGVNPFEVMEVISPEMVAVRGMSAHKNPEWKAVMNPRGPPPAVLNQESQLWLVESNPYMPVFSIKKNAAGEWVAKGYEGKFVPAEAPVRFYNYNS